MTARNLRVNEQIRLPQVRVIDQNNQQVGVIGTVDALNMARQVGLDLVEVAPNSAPSVCRIMDYGKWKYNQKKKDHKARVKQHHVILKEVRLRPKIDDHDKQVKIKRARQFIERGSKVQFTMMFRGREMSHREIGLKILNSIIDDLRDIAKVELEPKSQGRRMNMVLAPSPDNKKKTEQRSQVAKVETPVDSTPTTEIQNA